MAKAKGLKIDIKGIEWTIYAEKNATYTRKHGSDSEAITYTKDRIIYFNLNHFNPNPITHEIFHAYIASCGTNSSSLTTDQMEELACEIVAEHICDIQVIVKKILEYFSA